MWLIGRIYCTGTPEDYAAVHKIQDQLKLVPLSSFGKPFTSVPGHVDPSIDMKTPVRDQVNAMDAVAYFTLLAQLMKGNPPTAADAPKIARFAKIGLGRFVQGRLSTACDPFMSSDQRTHCDAAFCDPAECNLPYPFPPMASDSPFTA